MTISDMRKSEFHKTLTEAQKIGLRFIDQIPEPVTREQAESALVNLPGYVYALILC
jgi:DNA polymerase beta